MSIAAVMQTADRIGWYVLSWRFYLLCLSLSFLVMVEPAPTDLLFLIALGCFMLARVPRTRLVGPIEVAAMLIYVWFTVLSLLFVEHSMAVGVRAVGVEIYLLLLFLMTAYFVNRGGDQTFDMILCALVIGGLITSWIGIFAWLDLLPNREIFFRDEYMTRVKSTFKDPNVLGPYLVPSLLAALWAIVSVRRLRITASVVAVTVLLCLVLTFSRGAWLHMLLTIAIFVGYLLSYRNTAMQVLLITFAVVASSLLIGLLFGDRIFGTVENSYLTERLTLQSYDDDRFAHIRLGIVNMLDRPLGIGPNQAPMEFGYEPHNTFVILGLQNGIFAALGFALLYLAAIWRCLLMTLRRQAGWVKYAFVLSVLVGLFLLMNVVGSLHWRHLYVVMGLSYGRYTSNTLFAVEPPSRLTQKRSHRPAVGLP